MPSWSAARPHARMTLCAMAGATAADGVPAPRLRPRRSSPAAARPCRRPHPGRWTCGCGAQAPRPEASVNGRARPGCSAQSGKPSASTTWCGGRWPRGRPAGYRFSLDIPEARAWLRLRHRPRSTGPAGGRVRREGPQERPRGHALARPPGPAHPPGGPAVGPGRGGPRKVRRRGSGDRPGDERLRAGGRALAGRSGGPPR